MLKFVSILMPFVLMYKIYIIRVDKISKAINRNRTHSKFHRGYIKREYRRIIIFLLYYNLLKTNA